MSSLSSLLETIKSAQVFRLELTGTCRPGCELLGPESQLKSSVPGISTRGTAAQLSPWVHAPGHVQSLTLSSALMTSATWSTKIYPDLESLLHCLGTCPEWQVNPIQVGELVQVPGQALTSDWHLGYEFSLLTAWGHTQAVCRGGIFDLCTHRQGFLV